MSKPVSIRPDKATVAYAVNRAAAWRRRRYQDDDRYRHFTEAAMLEQVSGVEGVVWELGDGWWRVGVVLDVIAGVQLQVEANPEARKIRLREPAPRPDPPPPKPMLPAKPRAVSRVPDERGRNPLKWEEW